MCAAVSASATVLTVSSTGGRCGSQAEDIIDTGVAEEDFVAKGDARGAIYSASHRRQRHSIAPKPEPLSQSQSQFLNNLTLDDDYRAQLRIRYVMGVQIMIELQCQALVEKFKASPLICGVAGTIWLRFVATTRVFDDEWADKVIQDSEMQKPVTSSQISHKASNRSFQHFNPREAILPTDILKWSLEGKLPYFAAFIEIEKQIGPPSSPCPLSSSFMFRPSEAIPLQKLEAQAASIADFIGLHLPPVNFYAIAFRYLEQLFLPVERYFHMLAVYMSGQCLLTCDNIKMMDGAKQGSPLHDLNGSNEEPVTNSSHAQKSEFDATELLCNLDARYDELIDTYEYSKDLPTYLQYCKDVVFAGLELPFEDHEEEKIIEQLWEFYQNQKHSKEKKKIRDDCSVPLGLDGDDTSLNSQGGQKSVPTHQASVETVKEEAILRMKADMEENRFCYIPPRVNVKRFDYLHYVRKKDEGSYIYAAHADYYILLRACARVAQVDVRSMHVGVMSLERRLGWIEKRIDHCLHFKPPKFSSDSCNYDAPECSTDDYVEFSSLNLSP
ncbi:TATA box-binding protein-associated factor RNA polymerase I subunit B [Vitis vinifera]|uniref:TATA box-binding protein-associated factor RNA polymerase I subunit B n=1 Tax=Vitis vinifera TaxID=29760 RepID=A0A438CQB8_VITVI|nr:TATA box-binding protein-associated factor RNA polymerase I subunit B [Vitis vinifera]